MDEYNRQRIRQLQADLKEARAVAESYADQLRKMAARRGELQVKNERLRGALKHYANKDSWGDAGKLYGDSHARRPKSDLWMGEGDDGWTVACTALGEEKANGE